MVFEKIVNILWPNPFTAGAGARIPGRNDHSAYGNRLLSTGQAKTGEAKM